jgi:hypothetical protein
MKRYLILATLLVSITAAASEVTIPNDFTAGTPAVADDVDENFQAVKTAVDDNHNRITALEDQVVEIGAVSLSTSHFIDWAGNCVMRRFSNYAYFVDNPSLCTATAGVSLPHGATMTGFGCRFYDNESAPNVHAALGRTKVTTQLLNEPVYVTEVASDGTSPVFYATTTVLIPGGDLVDNMTYAYFISVMFHSDGGNQIDDQNLRRYGCNVYYTLGD